MYSQLSKLVHTGRGHPIVVVHVRQEVGEVILDVGQDFVHHAAYHRPVPTELYLQLAQAVRVREALQRHA